MALAGNPNSGKTTLFNAITGSHQHVGNYPGVTVEMKSGWARLGSERIEVVDLPGTYSLTAWSGEELVARNFLVEGWPSVVVDVVDASNLERNLYLAVQFLEMGIPLVVALNMVDVARGRGIEIGEAARSKRLGVPVVRTIGVSGEGLDALLATAAEVARVGSGKPWRPLDLSYGREMDEVLSDLRGILSADEGLPGELPPSWLAVKLLDADSEITDLVRRRARGAARIAGIIERTVRHTEVTLDDSPENILSDYRYAFISNAVAGCVTRPAEDRRTLTDRIDRVLTHRLVGPALLIGVIWLLYKFTFQASELPMALIDAGFGWLHRAVQASMADGPLRSLLVSGIIDGVGGVMSFVPIIMFMFFFIAILEDSGYMARMAFILDRLLRTFGMHGNSMLALIVSGGLAGGCAVPGVMATRTLRDPKERITTILVVPLLNCGAKLPVHALLIAAFFPAYRGEMMLLLTVLGWVFVVVAARILRSTVLSGDPSPFVMELPPYRVPTLRGLLIHMWERTFMYLKKAGTTILAASVILWALMNYPSTSPEAGPRLAGSVAGRMGSALE